MTTTADPKPEPHQIGWTTAQWYWAGVRRVVSIPALILMASFVGFGGLAREAGWGPVETGFMAATTWALPSLVVFVGTLAAGGSLITIIVAVALSAVRLLPMTVALMPILRGPDTPRWKLMGLSHFVAITAWVFAMRRLPDMPRSSRIPFFAGFATALSAANVAVVVASVALSSQLPPSLAAALTLLTPIYFVLALTAAARVRTDHLAMVVGLVSGPLVHQIDPQFDILWAGIVGGTTAYLIGRMWSRRGLSDSGGRV